MTQSAENWVLENKRKRCHSAIGAALRMSCCIYQTSNNIPEHKEDVILIILVMGVV